MIIDPDVLSLFTAPFRAHGPTGSEPVYVCDAHGHTAAWAPWGDTVAPRGWGRIQYLPNGEARYDRWCRAFEALVNGETDLDRIAELLTKAWGAP